MPGIVKLWAFPDQLEKDKQPTEKNWGKTKKKQPQNTPAHVFALLHVPFFFQKSWFFSGFQEQQCWGYGTTDQCHGISGEMYGCNHLSVKGHILPHYPGISSKWLSLPFIKIISLNGDFIPAHIFTLKNASVTKAHFTKRIIFQNGYGFIFLWLWLGKQFMLFVKVCAVQKVVKKIVKIPLSCLPKITSIFSVWVWAHINPHTFTGACVYLYFHKNEIKLFSSSTIYHEYLSMLINIDLPHHFKWMPILLQNECAIINLTTLQLINLGFFFFNQNEELYNWFHTHILGHGSGYFLRISS